MQRRRIVALVVLIGIAGAVAVLCAFASAIPTLQQHREFTLAVRAALRGAVYLGDAGVTLQKHGNDCGAAALRMVLAAHGVNRSLADLDSELKISGDGTSMLQLRTIATKAGVTGKSWALRPDELGRVPLPAIAFVNRDHFVVIERFIAPTVLEVADPALGRLKWPMKAFQKAWSGEILVFDPSWNPA